MSHPLHIANRSVRRNANLSVRPVFFALLAAGLPTLAQAASFQEVRDRIYAAPLSTLPQEEGLTPLSFLRAITVTSGVLVDRVKATLTDGADFKEAKPKLLHPMGVCAEARWKIRGSSHATGLLSDGTDVRAIVRFSTGDEQTTFSPTKKRIFGLAVKLFPTQSDSESVATRNLFTLDQSGLDGNVRENYLTDGPSQRTYFENKALGGGKAAELLNGMFALFDSYPSWRPLYPLTEVRADGRAVTFDVTPSTLRLVPRIEGRKYSAKDFRDEIRMYKAGEIQFAIVLPAQEAPFGTRQEIGTLIVGKPVLSTVCDRELHFHHHPNR